MQFDLSPLITIIICRPTLNSKRLTHCFEGFICCCWRLWFYVVHITPIQVAEKHNKSSRHRVVNSKWQNFTVQILSFDLDYVCIFFNVRSYVFFDCLVWNRRQHFNHRTRFSVYVSFWFQYRAWYTVTTQCTVLCVVEYTVQRIEYCTLHNSSTHFAISVVLFVVIYVLFSVFMPFFFIRIHRTQYILILNTIISSPQTIYQQKNSKKAYLTYRQLHFDSNCMLCFLPLFCSISFSLFNTFNMLHIRLILCTKNHRNVFPMLSW